MKNIDYPDIVRLARNEAVSIVAYDAPRLTKNPLQIVAFIRRFLSAYRLVRHAAKVEQVSAVLGMGGYSSFPAVFFAIVQRLPLYLCEQNARWGIVTRIARGVPVGGELEYVDSGTLAQALRERKSYQS